MLYPLTFKPIFKEVIWGGTDILPFKGLPADARKIGESWELSHVEQNFSVVSNGESTGQTIDEMIKDYGAQLLGAKVVEQSGYTFPLLIKFIDALDNLSVQVHPNDQLAQERHRSCGKTEMWYVVKAAPDAILYSGFSQPIDADEYLCRLKDDSIMEVLKKYHVKAGDVFFLPAGRVHAIGTGCFIAEIQQTSNITYRIYDYNRKEADGSARELHTDLAKEAIDYAFNPDYKTSYPAVNNEAVRLVQCRYFTTNLLKLTQPKLRDYATLDSFVIYMCTQGKAIMKDDKGASLTVKQGQTILIPANTRYITIEPAQPTWLLETYV